MTRRRAAGYRSVNNYSQKCFTEIFDGRPPTPGYNPEENLVQEFMVLILDDINLIVKKNLPAKKTPARDHITNLTFKRTNIFNLLLYCYCGSST